MCLQLPSSSHLPARRLRLPLLLLLCLSSQLPTLLAAAERTEAGAAVVGWVAVRRVVGWVVG